MCDKSLRVVDFRYFISVLFVAGEVAGILVDTKGKDFVLSLLQELHPQSTTIQISCDATTHVTVDAPFTGPSQSYDFTPGVHEISVNSILRETGSLISFKGIRIKSDEPISVHVVDNAVPDVGGFLALPVESLGNEYMVMSYTPHDKSEFLITSVMDQTKIYVHLQTKSNLTYLGQTYKNGDVIHETLDTFETWQVNSDSDLTGTTIKSDGKIAVFSGAQCAQVPEASQECGYIVEQLPTVTAWESSFVVPLLKQCDNIVRVVSRDEDTVVQYTFNRRTWSTRTNSTNFVDQIYTVQDTQDPVVLVESSRPILVALLIGSGTSSSSCKPSMTLIPGIPQYISSYQFSIPSELSTAVLSIIVPRAKLPGVRMNGLPLLPVWQVHASLTTSVHEFTVMEVDVQSASGPVLLNHLENIDFGAIIFGGRDNETFAFPLGMSMDLTDANEKVRLVGGNSAVNGRVEVLYRGNWGTICDVNFDSNEANVICRILGFYFGASNPTSGHYGAGSGIVMVDNLDCDGTENDLHLCTLGQWESSTCSHNQDVWVDCGTSVRLVGTNSNEGRVEVVFNGQWGTICDDEFGRQEAGVVCSSLGYGTSGYSFTGGGGSGPQWLDDLDCTGYEADIGQCMSKDWGLTDCSHDEDVWVGCYNATRIRLVDGPSPAEGRLEVMLDNQWHTVCDHLFDEQDATVVCSMLGYKSVGVDATVKVYPGAYFGQGMGQVAIDELNCTGRETDIAECRSRPWLVNSCSHLHDVGVSCGSKIRLMEGSSEANGTSGRLEVFYKDHWGIFCGDAFSNADAQVACKQLGFPYWSGLSPVLPGSMSSPGTSRLIVDRLQCVGNETDVAQCPSSAWLGTGITCSVTTGVEIDCGTSLRLVGGSSPTEGRVEVFYNGQWGTVCSNNFDDRDAQVICNSLGYKFDRRTVHHNAYYGVGSGNIVIDNLTCSGTKKDIQFCASLPWLTHGCSHSQDVGVDCGLRLADAVDVDCSPAGWNIAVNMQRLERVFPNSVQSNIVLGTQSKCPGSYNANIVTIARGLHECGTTELTTSSFNTYTNQVAYVYHDPTNPLKILNINWTMTMNCNIYRNGSSTMDIGASHVHGNDVINDTTHYTSLPEFYSDSSFTQTLPSNPLHVSINTDVYIIIRTTDADDNTKMVVQNCYASPDDLYLPTQRVYLIQNGCTSDSSVEVMLSDYHVFGFKFTVFEFSIGNGDVYIKCEEKFCSINDFSSNCTQRIC